MIYRAGVGVASVERLKVGNGVAVVRERVGIARGFAPIS
jgi:hypothetical protein